MEEIKKRGNAAAIFISKDNLIEPPDFYYGRVLAIDTDTVSLYDAHNKKMKVLFGGCLSTNIDPVKCHGIFHLILSEKGKKIGRCNIFAGRMSQIKM